MINTKKMFLVHWIFKFIPTTRGNKFKCYLLRWAGVKVGNNVSVFSSARFFGRMNLTIGNNCWIGHEALIFGADGSSIILEDYAKVGSRAIVVTGYHKYSTYGNCVAQEGLYKDIKICKGAVVGTAAIILPGITVHQMAHVVAGAVVTKDVPENCRVGGVPARLIRNLRDAE